MASGSRPKKKEPAISEKDELEASVFGKLVAEYQVKSEEEEFTNDVVVLFCGQKKSGKTSLVDRFINPSKADGDVAKPTAAVDYRFARYASENSSSKVLAHIYDLGGGDDSAEDLVSVPLSPEMVGNFVLAVTIDPSEPHSAFANLEKWLALLRDRAMKSLDALAKASPSGKRRVDLLRETTAQAWAEHTDQSAVRPMPIPLLIFGTKWDAMSAAVDPEKRKGLCRALRYLAHVNGASLIFTSIKEKPTMNLVRNILRKLLFGVEPKGGFPEQLDTGKPLSVMAAADNLQSIGAPQGKGQDEQAWRDTMHSLFPDTSPAAKAGGKSDSEVVQSEIEKHKESSIDGMVEQRNEELTQYRKQAERNQRLASEGIDTNKLAGITA